MDGGREPHHRRSIRLEDYDYSQAGAYFVTICTQGRRCLFGAVSNDAMVLSPAGQMIAEVWQGIPEYQPDAEVDALIVMPNHLHGIILLEGRMIAPVGATHCGCPPEGHAQWRAPTIGLGDLVGRFKSLTTRRYIEGLKNHGWRPFEGRLWQRNYDEHIIRNERALGLIRGYIADNPRRWAEDRENPESKWPRQTESRPAWEV